MTYLSTFPLNPAAVRLDATFETAPDVSSNAPGRHSLAVGKLDLRRKRMNVLGELAAIVCMDKENKMRIARL